MDKEEVKITIHKIIWYIVIFSIVGLVIETIFCYVTTGVIESRKGLVWGPFCPVYGVGAALVIIILGKFKNSYTKLFIYGSIVGNIIEYMLSYILEAMYGTRFWDYSFITLNLNGRICIKYSLFWGILAILLVKFIQPWIDKLIEKIPINKRNIINSIIIIYLTLDCIATVWGIKTYQTRVVNQYYNVQTKEEKNNILKLKTQIEDILFSNEKMKRTFPNLRYIDEQGNEYYIKEIINAN